MIDRKGTVVQSCDGHVTVSVNVTVKQSIDKETDIRCGFGVVVHCA